MHIHSICQYERKRANRRDISCTFKRTAYPHHLYGILCVNRRRYYSYLQYNTTTNVNVYYRLKNGMQYIVHIKTVGC